MKWVLGVCFLSFGLLFAGQVQSADDFDWETDIKTALAKAKEAKKPLLVAFR